MTGEYFDLAHLPDQGSTVCCRCSAVLILRAWVRQDPGDPRKLQIACLTCSEAIEAEEDRDRSV